jgi:hypothetical protein
MFKLALVQDEFAEGGRARVEALMGRVCEEVPLGDEALQWFEYVQALRSSCCRDILTIEREVGDGPVCDIKNTVRFPRSTREGRI